MESIVIDYMKEFSPAQLRGKLVFIVRMAFTRSNDEYFESDGRVASSELRHTCTPELRCTSLDLI